MSDFYTLWKNEVAAQGNPFWNSLYYQRWKQQLARQGYQEHQQKPEQSWQTIRIQYRTHPLTEQQQRDRRLVHTNPGSSGSLTRAYSVPMACLFCGHLGHTQRTLENVTVPCCSVCHGCILHFPFDGLLHHLTRILSYQIANSLTLGSLPEFVHHAVPEPSIQAGPVPLAVQHLDHPFHNPECECIICGIPRRQVFLVSLRLTHSPPSQVPCCVLCKAMIAQVPIGQFLRWTIICHERLTELAESEILQGTTLQAKVKYLVDWLGTSETGINKEV